MASEDGIETDSPYFPSNSIIPQTVLEDLCRLVRNYSCVFFYFVVWLLISAYCFFLQPFLDQHSGRGKEGYRSIVFSDRNCTLVLCWLLQTRAAWSPTLWPKGFYQNQYPFPKHLPSVALRMRIGGRNGRSNLQTILMYCHFQQFQVRCFVQLVR